MNLIYFRAEPDLEFEGLLKRQHTRVKYFQGSLMNAMDLERSKVTGLKNKQRSISCLLFCQFALKVFVIRLSRLRQICGYLYYL